MGFVWALPIAPLVLRVPRRRGRRPVAALRWSRPGSPARCRRRSPGWPARGGRRAGRRPPASRRARWPAPHDRRSRPACVRARDRARALGARDRGRAGESRATTCHARRAGGGRRRWSSSQAGARRRRAARPPRTTLVALAAMAAGVVAAGAPAGRGRSWHAPRAAVARRRRAGGGAARGCSRRVSGPGCTGRRSSTTRCRTTCTCRRPGCTTDASGDRPRRVRRSVARVRAEQPRALVPVPDGAAALRLPGRRRAAPVRGAGRGRDRRRPCARRAARRAAALAAALAFLLVPEVWGQIADRDDRPRAGGVPARVAAVRAPSWRARCRPRRPARVRRRLGLAVGTKYAGVALALPFAAIGA